MATGISIAVCTKDRPDYLLRCLSSICQFPPKSVPWEALVVDDGELPSNVIRGAEQMVSNSKGVFRYLRAQHPGGLIQARLTAIAHAAFDIITFLDDDVEITQGYFERLQEAFKASQDIAGVGGVDLNTKPAPIPVRVWQRLFLIRSARPGRLSVSGFNRSQDEWLGQQGTFESEFLHGCNMSFRRSALERLPAPPFLRGYSLGEDLYLSWWARQRGRLLVDPRMTVRHSSAPRSRPSESELYKATLINHWHLLRLRGPSPIRAAAFVWSSVGLFGQLVAIAAAKFLLGDLVGVQRNLKALEGVCQGVSELLRMRGLGAKVATRDHR